DRAPGKVFGVAVFIDGGGVGDGGVPRDGREIDLRIGHQLHGEAILRTPYAGIGGNHGGRHIEVGGDGSGALESRVEHRVIIYGYRLAVVQEHYLHVVAGHIGRVDGRREVHGALVRHEHERVGAAGEDEVVMGG